MLFIWNFLFISVHNIIMINYDEEVIKILKVSEIEAYNLSHQYVSSEHVILAILKEKNSLTNIFKSTNISYDEFKNIIVDNIKESGSKIISFTPLLKKILYLSIDKNTIKLKNLVICILEEENCIANTLLKMLDVDIKKICNHIKNEGNFKYGINLNNNSNLEKKYYFRKELNDLIEVLCRKNKCNPLLIGEAGVGKTALVESLAYKINKKEVPNELLDKQIISINMANILSGTKYRGEFEEKLENIIKEAEDNNNYILFIDEIHTIMNTGSSEGSIDAGNILKPYLARNKIKLIGATTLNEYNNSIKKDKALNRRFQTIYIKEPNKEETRNIILSVKKSYEIFHNVNISTNIVNKIIELSSMYIKDKKEPDRSLDTLDKACTKVKLKNNFTKEIIRLKSLKNNYIINKEFDKAKLVNNKLFKAKNKHNNLKISDILDCFNSDLKNTDIGFKIS